MAKAMHAHTHTHTHTHTCAHNAYVCAMRTHALTPARPHVRLGILAFCLFAKGEGEGVPGGRFACALTISAEAAYRTQRAKFSKFAKRPKCAFCQNAN